MLSPDEIIKVVRELSDSKETKEKIKLFYLLSGTILCFLGLKYLLINTILPFVNFITDLNKYQPIDLLLIYLLLFIFAFVITNIPLWLPLKIFYSLGYITDYSWKSDYGLSDWEFQGNIIVDEKEKAIHIIQSELGMILRNRRWRDYEMSFKFKIPKVPQFSPRDAEDNQLRRGFGVIYRARSLGEYYMLKVDTNGYIPHVRHVLWENNGRIANISFSANDLNKWIYAKLIMRKNRIAFEFGKDKFYFLIPTHSTVSPEPIPRSHEASVQAFPYSKIPFHNEGSIGFRSAFFEEVYIKDLVIKNKLDIKFYIRDFLLSIKKIFDFILLVRFRRVNI